MRTLSKAVLLIALASPLMAGCQSLFGRSAMRGTEFRIAAQVDPLQYAGTEMARGYKALDDQQYGLAIIAFRNAQGFADHRAAAFNGLAIAYSQIGRPDLAERFFKQAIAENSSDPRYQANLANFYGTRPQVAARSAIGESLGQSPLVAARPESISADRLIAGNRDFASISIERPASRTVRVSLGEVRVALAATPTAVERRRNPRQVAITTNAPERRPNIAYIAKNSGPAPRTVRFEMPRPRDMRIVANEVRQAPTMPQAGFQRRRSPAGLAMAAARLAGNVPEYPIKLTFLRAR